MDCVTASLNPLQNSTINNAIALGSTGNPGTISSNVAGGITANWNGPISGAGGAHEVRHGHPNFKYRDEQLRRRDHN